MTFSQYAGIAILPTLSRIVLCAAFVSAGYNKVFVYPDFSHEQAVRLHNVGVNVKIKAPATASREVSELRSAIPASFSQEQEPAATESNPPATVPDATAPVLIMSPPGAAGTLPPGIYNAQGLHHVTLMLIDAKWQYAVLLANIAAFTELIGGAMLLVGLFSRLWSLGLTIAMGVAFYLTTMNIYFEVGPLLVGGGMGMVDGVIASDGHKLFSTVYSQIGLGLLAFGIFLTGPGPLSLDRVLFGRSREAAEADQVKAD